MATKDDKIVSSESAGTASSINYDDNKNAEESSTSSTQDVCCGTDSTLDGETSAANGSCVFDDSGIYSGKHSRLQPQKSVCFHSGTSLPAERKISNALDCLHYMIGGSNLVKVRASARQYRRYFSLEEDLTGLRWVPSTKKSSKARLSIRSIREVRTGKSTDILRNKEVAGHYSEDCAFSVIYGENFESLDLVASTPDEANIWVTGLNFLLGANKSPESVEERQRMREQWLKDVFQQADTEQKGMLDEWETIALMKKLNSQLSTVRLKQKIMEFDFGKDEDARGRIDCSSFVNIFKETATRPDIYFILVRYCGKDYMSIEDLQFFLEGEQEVTGATVDICDKLIHKYECSDEARKNKQLLIDGFTQYLLSEDCDIISPTQRTVCQDMTQPLSHYFISSSYNTYLLEDQLKGPSSVQGYVRALQQGCRCVKLDCWDSPSGPVVYHGNTLTSKVSLQEVLEAICEHAFSVSEYPLFLHLENHCSIENQLHIAAMLKNILGDLLYIPSQEGALPGSHYSPEELKRKILLKSKKLPPYCTVNGDVSEEDDASDCKNSKDCLKKITLSSTLSKLVSFTRIKFIDFQTLQEIQKEYETCSMSEPLAAKLSQACPEEFVHHNKQFLTQVVPSSSRVDSSNFNPIDFWSCGCHLVCMNFQTSGQMMDLYQGWFQQNGQCGYVLKPSFLRENYSLFNAHRKDSLPRLEPLNIRLKVISGQQLPRPRGASSKATAIDPYVLVQICGIPADCAEARTRTVSNEGSSPIFDESFELTVNVPELALLRIVVLDDEYIGDDFIGQQSIPVECLQPGYRHIRLRASNGEYLPNATLFVHVAMTRRYGSKQKLRRKRSWSSKQQTEMKPVGIKQIDDVFKNVSNPLMQSVQLRKEAEKAFLELCDECNLPESANMPQCLRVIALRLASCASVTDCKVIAVNGFPVLKVQGELTARLNKAVTTLEKVLTEYRYIIETAEGILETINKLYDLALNLGDELAGLCTTSGIKGRKADKVAENFMWNTSVIRVESGQLWNVKDECSTALKQVERLGQALVHLFHRERLAVADEDSIFRKMPGLGNLTPEPEPEPKQPPRTPTSPNDGRLRSILKKTSYSYVPPQSDPCNSQHNKDSCDYHYHHQHHHQHPIQNKDGDKMVNTGQISMAENQT